MMATEAAHSPLDTDTAMLDPSADPSSQPTPPPTAGRKRPRIEMSTLDANRDTGAGDRERNGQEGREKRRRGKSMFGLLVGTLNKAKDEDRARGSSEAAKKRQELEQRLQERLRKETDSVRRAEEAKKDKTAANRKEEELQLRDSIHKLRHTRVPILANFLLTSDIIPNSTSPPSSPMRDADEDENVTPSGEGGNDTIGNDIKNGQSSAAKEDVLAGPPRSHPPPLYYLPAVLTPAQETFLKARKEKIQIAAEAEWSTFVTMRSTGITEIARLRQRAADEDARFKTTRQANGEGEKKKEGDEEESKEEVHAQDGEDVQMEAQLENANGRAEGGAAKGRSGSKSEEGGTEATMDVDDSGAAPGGEKIEEKDVGVEKTQKARDGEKDRESAPAHAPLQADDDDAVEY